MGLLTNHTIAIIDDEPHARDVVKQYLARLGDAKMIVEASNGADAVGLIIHKKPGIVFLDIQMPELDGFEVLQHLAPENLAHAVVFSTAYDQYALKAFDANAVDYLLKPYTFERFETAVGKALNMLQQKQYPHVYITQLLQYLSQHPQKPSQQPISRIFVKESKRAFFIGTDDIGYIEAADYYSMVFIIDGKKHLVASSLADLEQKLDPKKFIRIHRSHIVNLDFVKEFLPHFNGEYLVMLQDGTQLKLSRNYKENLKHLI